MGKRRTSKKERACIKRERKEKARRAADREAKTKRKPEEDGACDVTSTSPRKKSRATPAATHAPAAANVITPIRVSPRSATAAAAQTPGTEVVHDVTGALGLAADLCSTLPRGVWWKIMPDLEAELDISTGSRQDWSLIVPVYIKAGLFKSCATEDSSSPILRFQKKKNG